MPPLRLNKNPPDRTPNAAAPQPVALAPKASPTARQFKILQSSRAPAQLSLALRRA
jgi:hypothetical protein